MGTCLLIAEKPSAARKFAAALGGMQGSFDGQPYRIVALRGHLMELARPEEQVAPEHAGRMASWDPAAMPWDPPRTRRCGLPTTSITTRTGDIRTARSATRAS